ncbi:hypothetical protein E1A91_D05G326300v1 [Gossypium mustelinum]|uniref:Uncharacterized protein n=2 Tax=Gossypium TaxID=3633 RepID=A0A5J5RPK6_GOSBA|nr:hypothetical protein ES319_D05G319400v1 [Gossypium barbadense]TYI83902.1 hypothetical protein E1A91_D05G326300v1 [Gossypium mustelinum]
MKSLSSVGLGLSIVFGCLVLALIAEVYYLLWWKNRLRTSTDLENDLKNPEIIFAEEEQSHHHHHHRNLQSNKDLLLKPLDEEHGNGNGNGNDEQLPPRFLFTITEETMEDLESFETPYLTPFSSPPFFTPPLTPIDVACFSHQLGFNPLFESEADANFNRLSSSSSSSSLHPPASRFKFLKEAEVKLHRKPLKEDVHNNGGFKLSSDYLREEEDGSFITIIVDNNKEERFSHINQHQSRTPSQVLRFS